MGKLYIDGEYICDTLEDRYRGLTQNMPLVQITSKKVYGETAIPEGTYVITMAVKSQKYSKKTAYSFTGGYMPRLLNVPGYEGVLIHGGNTDKDTLGCILVGKNSGNGTLVGGSSLPAFKKVFEKLYWAKTNKKEITITIG